MAQSHIKKSEKAKRIFISAGEASGDNLGYELIQSILKLHPDTQIAVVGGSKIESLGYKSVFPQSDISVMGYFEILSSIFRVKKRINQTIEFLKEFKPDLYIAIDSRGFNFRVIEGVRKFLPKTKYLNYVSCTIWAYRYKRIFKIKELFNHQFVLYPFEKKYYDEVKIPCTFIGHPLGYEASKAVNSYRGNADRESYIVSIFPGSRIQEIKAHMPIFLDSARLFYKKISKKLSDDDFRRKLKIFIPTLPHLKKVFCEYDFGDLDVKVSDDLAVKEMFLCKSRIFLTKSGTISLELMRYNIPMIVAHKISSFTAFFVKRFLKVRYVSIGNLIADEEIIPELLQENCNPSNIAGKMVKIESVAPNYDACLLKLKNNSNLKPQDLAVKVIFAEIL